jgi:Immunoglobulin domain
MARFQMSAFVVAAVHLVMSLSVADADLPRVHGQPSRIYLPRGLAGRLECPTDSNPPTNRVTWSKNERIIDLTSLSSPSASRFKINRQGSLLIQPVEVSDEGRYTCTPYSSLGVGHQSMPVQVFVRGKQIFAVFF